MQLNPSESEITSYRLFLYYVKANTNKVQRLIRIKQHLSKNNVRSNQNVINRVAFVNKNMTYAENNLCCYDFDSLLVLQVGIND